MVDEAQASGSYDGDAGYARTCAIGAGHWLVQELHMHRPSSFTCVFAIILKHHSGRNCWYTSAGIPTPESLPDVRP